MKTALVKALALVVLLVAAPAFADEGLKDKDPDSSCFVCGPGSTGGCDECKYDGHDSPGRRTSCEKLGCVITGKDFCTTKKDKKVCVPAT
ncbi:MAG TPA: hypothetical protein VGK67_16975 [Myxococcales bacterium]